MLKKIYNLLIIIGLFVVFILVFIWSVSFFIVKKGTVVPNVVNMNLEEAQHIFRKHHLKYIIEGNDPANLKKNKIKYKNIEILNQYPPAGEIILKKFKISLFIRIIEEMTKVPNILGLDSVNARFEVENNNLIVGKISYIKSKVDLNDKVIFQEPIAGTSVKKGTPINFYINTGVIKKYILVPYFMDNEISYVKSSIRKIGLFSNDDSPKGVIVSQSLIPGDIVPINSQIIFDVLDKNMEENNTAPLPIEVPTNKKKFYIINYTFSSFMGTRRGKIYISSSGKKEQLLNKNIKAGYNYKKLITYKGTAIIEIYLDGKKIFKKELN